MIRMPHRLMKFVASHSDNYALMGLITFSTPRFFLKSIYARNNGTGWLGNKACLTLSFDCDYPEDVQALPELIQLMKGYPFRASFACVGHWIEKYPKEHSLILENGHEIINHTYSHPDNELLNPGRKFRHCNFEEKIDEVERCHRVCEKILGYSPAGLRIPHFKDNFKPDIYKILTMMNYTFSSSTWVTNTVTSGLPFRAEGDVVEFPLSNCPVHPFTVFDTWHILHSQRWVYRVGHRGNNGYAESLENLLGIGLDTNSYMNIYLDPLDIPAMPHFRKILDRLASENIAVVTYGEYLKRFPENILPTE